MLSFGIEMTWGSSALMNGKILYTMHDGTWVTSEDELDDVDDINEAIDANRMGHWTYATNATVLGSFFDDGYGDSSWHVLQIELLEWGTVLRYNDIVLEWDHNTDDTEGYLILEGASEAWDNQILIEDMSCTETCTAE